MLKPACKFCRWWEPFSGACCNGDSENRADFMVGDDSCIQWERNVHEGCGGTLEGKVHGKTVEHYCHGCNFTVLIDGKPVSGATEYWQQFPGCLRTLKGISEKEKEALLKGNWTSGEKE